MIKFAILRLVASASALSSYPTNPPKITNQPKSFDTRPTRDLPKHFAEKWAQEKNYRPEGSTQIMGFKNFERHGDAIKLVVGVPMILRQAEIFDAHLKTWVTGENVCKLKEHADPKCAIFPVFLLGNSTAAKKKAQNASNFALALPIPEADESDDGLDSRWDGYNPPKNSAEDRTGRQMAHDIPFLKYYLWLKHATDDYSWATHFAKMDADTYPHFKPILNDLANGPKYNLYWGAKMWGDHCEGGFMQGALYIVSANLQACAQPVVHKMCPESTWNFANWKICKHLSEDWYYGECVFQAVTDGICPKPTCMNVRFAHRYEHRL